MLWRATPIDGRIGLLAARVRLLMALVRPLAAIGLALGLATAHGQSLESAISPGAVHKTHAKIEHECAKCHTRFRPSAQPGLCLACHREIAADQRQGTGFHGHAGDAPCRQCHTDHRGRDGQTVILDEKTFDHRLTDFQLRGAHRDKTCAGCHRAGKKHREAPSDCVSCHRGNDKHRGNLGPRCETCHGEETWKTARFDHGRTRFPLLHRHVQVRCADCHVDERYAGTARDCVACHRADDAHKGHNGPRCETCHSEQDWRSTLFRHDRDTSYPLLGRHQGVTCTTCHRAPLYKQRPASQCAACHQQDDTHGGTLGSACATCHHPTGWRGRNFEHDVATVFPLKARHRSVKCDSCHTAPGLREKPPLACVGCHVRDDRERGHKGRYGGRCETCHNEQAWRDIHFEHARDTRFPTAGRHRQVNCDACHRAGPYQAKADSRCHSCHKEDDIHFGSFGEQCEHCHLADDWRKISREATDRYCRGRETPTAGQTSAENRDRKPDDKHAGPHEKKTEDRLNVDFWIPYCVADLRATARPPRRPTATPAEKGRQP